MALRRLERPKAVVLGLEPDDPSVETIRHLFPYTAVVESMGDVRQADFDVVIAFGQPPNGLNSTSHLLWLHGDSSQQLHLDEFVQGMKPGTSFGRATLATRKGDRSSEFDVPTEALAMAPQTLIETLEPSIRDYWTLAFDYEPLKDLFERTYLLTEKGGGLGIIGLVAERLDNQRQIWALPLSARSRLLEWLEAAIQQWRTRAPEAFPHLEWVTSAEWMASDELNAAAKLRQHDNEAEATIKRLDDERKQLVDAQAAARAAADQGLRRLLTTNSDVLVDAVSSTLKDLGFRVVDADSLPRVRKFEDLQVFDGKWVVLVEVKGYEKRNAKTADLMQLAGFVSHYQEDNPAPSAQWYIINQSYGTSPSRRLEPFTSDPDTVQQFANNNGLVIDTRELFRLTTRVHQGALTRDQARELLREARGVFTLPIVEQD